MTLLRPKTLVTTAVLFLLAGCFVGSNHAQVRLPAPRVTLNASPTSITPGRQVTFVAQLSSSYPNIRFRFEFGDGAQTAWQSSPVVTHIYQTAGNYRPFVDIGVAASNGVTRLGGSVRRLVQVTDAPAGPVDLFINPATAEIGRAVTLTVRTGSNNPNLRYRFAFGDGSPVGGWQSSPQRMHVYSNPGTYIASVDVALMTNRGIQQQGSSRRGITVSAPVALRALRMKEPARSGKQASVATSLAKTSATQTKKSSSSTKAAAPVSALPPGTPSPSSSPYVTPAESGAVASTATGGRWSRYLWLLLPLAFLAFILGRWFFGKPEVRSHVDPGTASVVEAKGLVRNTQVVSPLAASEGAGVVSSDSPLVKNVRREDG